MKYLINLNWHVKEQFYNRKQFLHGIEEEKQMLFKDDPSARNLIEAIKLKKN